MKQVNYFSKNKRTIIILIMIVSIMLLTACGGSNNTDGTNKNVTTEGNSDSNVDGSDGGIKIGAMLIFSGPFAVLGESMKNGFNLFLDQHDNKLGGKDVEVIFEDTKGDPKTALRKYRQLVQGDKVDLLVGPVLSSSGFALLEEADEDEILLIDPNGTTNPWEKKSDYVFRVSVSNWQNGYATAHYTANEIGKKAVAVGFDYIAGEENLASFKRAFEEAGGVVEEEIYTDTGTTDFASYLTKIKRTAPDVVYAFLSGNDAINFIKQYNEFGLKDKIPLVGSREFGDVLVTGPAGKDAEGIISGIMYSPWLENETNKRFVQDYEDKYGELPNGFSVQGYSAAQIIDKGISKAGSVQSEDLTEAMSGITYNSPSGEVTIDPETKNPIQDFYIAKNKMRDGQIIPEIIEKVGAVKMPASPPDSE